MSEIDPRRVMIPAAVLSFDHLWFSDPQNPDKPRHTSKFIIDPSDEATMKLIQAGIDTVLKEDLGGVKLKGDKVPLRAGNELMLSSKTGEPYDGYADKFFVSAARNAEKQGRPKLLNRDQSAIVNPQQYNELFYPGAKVNAILRFWGQKDKQNGTRVNCTIEVVQHWEHGTRLASGEVDTSVLPTGEAAPVSSEPSLPTEEVAASEAFLA